MLCHVGCAGSSAYEKNYRFIASERCSDGLRRPHSPLFVLEDDGYFSFKLQRDFEIEKED